jgi:hypothetical protein
MQTDEFGASLLGALAAVPDPRSRHGRRHPLPAVLALARVAMLCGARSLYAIAQWGREHAAAVVRTLGFTRQPPAGVAPLHRGFKRLNVAGFAAGLAQGAPSALGARRSGTGGGERDRRQSAARHPRTARGASARRPPGRGLRCADGPRAGPKGG